MFERVITRPAWAHQHPSFKLCMRVSLTFTLTLSAEGIGACSHVLRLGIPEVRRIFTVIGPIPSESSIAPHSSRHVSPPPKRLTSRLIDLHQQSEARALEVAKGSRDWRWEETKLTSRRALWCILRCLSRRACVVCRRDRAVSTALGPTVSDRATLHLPQAISPSSMGCHPLCAHQHRLYISHCIKNRY